MGSKIVKKTSKYLTIQVNIPIEGKDMLTHEEAIQMAVNEAGVIATQYVLSQYDTDGSPVKVDKEKYTSKGQVSKIY
ncbi:MAG: hypothetical protein LBC98_08235 [Prevotellaceae bacterium]|jgi:hypothetical protein|nr:hypothetical protein [Prevotellaceae bacterium]